MLDVNLVARNYPQNRCNAWPCTLASPGQVTDTVNLRHTGDYASYECGSIMSQLPHPRSTEVDNLASGRPLPKAIALADMARQWPGCYTTGSWPRWQRARYAARGAPGHRSFEGSLEVLLVRNFGARRVHAGAPAARYCEARRSAPRARSDATCNVCMQRVWLCPYLRAVLLPCGRAGC
jgi:hypothetical protein